MNEVKLHEDGLSKFVLLKDEDGNLLLCSDPFAEFHSEIHDSENKRTKMRLKCLGGGRLYISEDEIYAYGYSVDYGKPPADVVAQLLTEYADGKNKKVRVEIGTSY